MKKFFTNIFCKKTLIITASLICACALIFPAAVFATEYVAANDPLVTLSYLMEIFAPMIKEEIVAEVDKTSDENVAAVSSGYEVLELSQGQFITSNGGTVELIVRPGSSAIVVSDIPENGLSDISEMKEVLDGMEVGINHALIIPRGDGRGVEITSEKAYVLIRGDFLVVD